MGKQVDEIEAVNWLAQKHSQMKPIRYPGGLNKSWSMTCGKCGKECSPTLANLKRGQGPCKPLETIRPR